MTIHSRRPRLTRREALNLLGAGAGLGVAAALRTDLGLAAAPGLGAPKVTFPKGAIIRTVLKDVPPEALGSGATLFHEHISIYDPSPSWLPPRKDGPPFSANLDLMVDEVRASARDGVSCIVNGGTKDLGKTWSTCERFPPGRACTSSPPAACGPNPRIRPTSPRRRRIRLPTIFFATPRGTMGSARRDRHVADDAS